jgi:shikimate dehydrogenase
MHLAALKQARLSGHYLPLTLKAENVPPAIKGLAALGFKGLNVTAPHKEVVIPHLTRLSPEAQAIGAVNTLVPDQGGFSGHNTDAPGFAAAYLKERAAQQALIYGAGGAARAVIQALRTQGFSVSVTARNLLAAQKLAQEFGQKALALADLPNAGTYSFVINATSASYAADLNPVPPLTLANNAIVIDLNYGRPDNHWQKLAANSGGLFYDGLPMLAWQACLSFNLWTGANLGITPFSGALAIYLRDGLTLWP